MKLLTREIMDRMPECEAQDEAEWKEVHVKFFTPWSGWSWYAVGGEAVMEDGGYRMLKDVADVDAPEVADVVFFGFVEGFEKEWGTFSLRELQDVSGPAGLRIERDMYFDDMEINIDGEVRQKK